MKQRSMLKWHKTPTTIYLHSHEATSIRSLKIFQLVGLCFRATQGARQDSGWEGSLKRREERTETHKVRPGHQIPYAV